VPPGRDEGTRYQPVAKLGFQRRGDVTPHIGLIKYGYGYSRRPYGSMVELDGEYAIAYNAFRVGVTADQRLESSPIHFMAVARMSEFEVVNFAGLGNATSDSASSYNDVHQTQWMFHPAIALVVGSRTDLSLGPVIQHAVTDSARSPYLAANRPYGVGTFDQVGVQLGARYVWRAVRADRAHPLPTVVVGLDGLYFPPALDVRSAFEEVVVNMGLGATLPVPTHPYLAVAAGGKKLFGDFPYYEAAFIGGRGTTRQMATQRYAGDASLYATSELRIPIVRVKLLVPLRVGIMGLAEAGRVYDQGNSPGGWHPVTGGGLWFGRDASAVLTIIRTTEQGRSGVHIATGLHF
jgi:hypothetical protein